MDDFHRQGNVFWKEERNENLEEDEFCEEEID
jgi:hypothetical protein